MLIIANWKMNPQLPEEARDLFQKTKEAASSLANARAVVCPPYVFLGLFVREATHVCALGVQNVSEEQSGAHTGDISAGQVAALGGQYAIVGHSERRARGETNEAVAQKARAALEAGLTPIVCIGEHERDEEGAYLSFLRTQITESLHGMPKKLRASAAIAYEPIWAVGENAVRADTPEDLLEVSIFIRKVLTEEYGARLAEAIPVLYGGSVNAENAGSFLSGGGVRGLLVGRASLDADEFAAILKDADTMHA